MMVEVRRGKSRARLLISKVLFLYRLVSSCHLVSIVILLTVEKIRSTTSQVDDLRATIAIFLQSCALEAIESV
jgi:hypothetical protein